MDKPKKLDRFMYYLIKEASRYSLMEFIEEREISEEEYREIELFFKDKLNIQL